MPEAKFPKLLIDPNERVDPSNPKSPFVADQYGPLMVRWYRDPLYRRWEEAKSLTARWKITQKLAQKVSDWLKLHGITAYREFRAAGFRNEAAARASFEASLKGNAPKEGA